MTHPRASWRPWWAYGAVAVLVVLVAWLIVQLRGQQSHEPQRSYTKSPQAKLLPLPKPVRGVTLPRWTVHGEPERTKPEHVTDEVTLPNGTRAVMFAGKASYPALSPVDVHLQLFNRDGMPLSGRRDLELLALDPSTESHGTGAIKLGLAERYDDPGNYDAIVAAPRTWSRVTLLLDVSENGGGNTPGATKLVQVMVDHSAAVSIDRVHDAVLSARGVDFVVGVSADRAETISLRAELRDGEGRTFGQAAQTSRVEAGANKVVLHYAQPSAGNPSANHAFYLMDLTLFVGDRAVDLRADPLPVFLRK
jgi:hypothetical protein